MKTHYTFFKHPSMKIASLLLAASVSAASLQPVLATSRKTQAEDAKRAAESSLNSVNNDISSITSQQQVLQQEINALDSELVELLINMDILSDELDDKKEEIKQADKDLKAAQKEEADQYERMKKRIRYMYERGDNSILEALVCATSMSDFLNKVNYCNAVYDYDRDQLALYKETKQAVIDLKAQLETEESEMEEMQDNYKVQESNLKEMVAKKEATMDDFDSQLSQARTLAAAYKNTIQQQNDIIRDEEEKERQAAEAARRAAEEAQRAAQAAAQAAADEAAAAQARAAAQAAAATPAPSTSTGTSSSGSSAPSAGTGTPAASVPAPSASASVPVNSSGISGQDVINYATQFIGNPYVWGGTSLTNGADCSGFVQSVYAHFGYSLPRVSDAQAGAGRGVSYSEAQPGDIICYSGHVALYMGNGMIVGAQSSRSGITTQTATYRTIVAVRRIIN